MLKNRIIVFAIMILFISLPLSINAVYSNDINQSNQKYYLNKNLVVLKIYNDYTNQQQQITLNIEQKIHPLRDKNITIIAKKCVYKKDFPDQYMTYLKIFNKDVLTYEGWFYSKYYWLNQNTKNLPYSIYLIDCNNNK